MDALVEGDINRLFFLFLGGGLGVCHSSRRLRSKRII